ncbi:DUF4880 domain-containing protein [Pseudomonas putida]|uniref:DUF4880 domain-containing protein n=1 Tax=Pseudomonas putida TaxID=303 RepID=A0AAP9N2L3_PSEPU|nr:FecR domain-containing protein [Pseudomonas putida]QJQ11550.1 DUF4880 domain-containing protein [Pseudomonas putida]
MTNHVPAAPSTTLESEQSALEAATLWYVTLTAEDAGDTEQHAWQQWINSSPLNARAWQRLQALTGRLGAIDPYLARTTLCPPNLGRRKIVKGLALILLTSAAGLGTQYPKLREARADYRTRQGQRQTINLVDGSHLQLNGATAVDVRFDDTQRLLHLFEGELLIETGHLAAFTRQPLIIETAHGQLEAIGTRFMVSRREDQTIVEVYEGAVLSRPRHGSPLRLDAGMSRQMDSKAASAPGVADQHHIGWPQGLVFANDMTLEALARQLTYQHPGWITCDREVATLRISGVFPLNDRARALKQIQQTLPVSIHRYSSYWVRLGSSEK